MEAALYDEQRGYYSRKDLVRWGRQGDYRTSPERSVLFGSTFARYFSQLFAELGSPEHFQLVEVGPGAGHFASAALETLERRYPDVFTRLTYVLDEVSQDACEQSSQRLARFENKVEFKLLADIPSIDPGIVFANELLDAFPIHRITLQEGEIAELYVGLDNREEFTWTRGPVSDPRLLAYLERFSLAPAEGQILEINLAARDWIQQVSLKLKRGYLILVDYGAQQRELHDSSRRDGTLRSFSKHEFGIDVLRSPGSQDITSSVDWSAVIEFGREFGFETIQFERQDRFLLERGLLDELESRAALVESEAEKMRLRTSAREMVLPGGMAQSFQVLVLMRANPGS
jgi:SAM-dependent MidA family methyltransferase